MCGINGIIDFANSIPSELIHLMNKNLEHRGPDGNGFIRFDNLHLGHTRLSIQDLSEKGQQPMSNDGIVWIIFNGEVYNFKEIRNELEAKNYKFYSNTDTEVILNSYKEWGDSCFLKFNGMWALSIYDKNKKELILSRDRYGVKPCYLYNQNQRFIFSSEIKPILSATNDDIDPNKRLLREVLLERYFTTAYKNINILEPGHLLKINLNSRKIEKKRWWNGLENLAEINPNKKKIIEELKNRLDQAINLRLISDVKIATSLSGGLDSSIIFSELNEKKSKIVNLNPFIVKYKGNITYDKAIKFAEKLNKSPTIVDGEKVLNFDEILSIFGSIEKKEFYSKQIELYKAQKLNGFKVSIDGHGADECLGGYVDNLKDISISLHNNLVDSFKSIYEIEGSNLDNILKKNYLTKLDYNINTFVDNFFDIENSNFVYANPKADLQASQSILDDLINLKNFDFSFQSLYIKSNFGFLQWLLNKWDRASMRNSVEIRSPYLDWNFFQYALCIPGYLKVHEGRNKAILRDAFLNKIPNEIIYDKKKQGLIVNSEINYTDVILNNALDDSAFKDSSSWDSKKIIQDIKNKSLDPANLKEITKIFNSYAYEQGMKKMTVKSTDYNLKTKDNFNLLNTIN